MTLERDARNPTRLSNRLRYVSRRTRSLVRMRTGITSVGSSTCGRPGRRGIYCPFSQSHHRTPHEIYTQKSFCIPKLFLVERCSILLHTPDRAAGGLPDRVLDVRWVIGRSIACSLVERWGGSIRREYASRKNPLLFQGEGLTMPLHRAVRTCLQPLTR